VELRDNEAGRYLGRGVRKAVDNVNNVIARHLAGEAGPSPFDQAAIDHTLLGLDPSGNKSQLGANAILAVSLAVAHAAARSRNISLWRYLAGDGPVSLPVPMFNILNGGRHASNSTDVQEFMVVPVGVGSFSEALRAGVEIYHSLRDLLRQGGHNLNVGDEGGFAPTLPSNRDALELVLQAVEKGGYTPGKDVFLALDVAASELYQASSKEYLLEREGASFDAEGLVEVYARWARDYPIISIEDGLDEDDWDGWAELRRRIGGPVQLVGDDLLVTNKDRIQKGIDTSAANSVLLKPNQIGSLTETREALELARGAGWGAVMSHRSGETEDTTIADLSVAWNVGQIKAGAPARSDRVAKYNRLLRIEAELEAGARYAGREAFEFLTR
jgi:enolase